MEVHKMLAKVHGETNRASRRQAMAIGNWQLAIGNWQWPKPQQRNDMNEANLTITK
jgi:hypothetical protein